MNAMLSDEELAGLLAEAASDFPVPELELDLPAHPQVAWWQRRRWQGAAAAAVLVCGALLASPSLSGGDNADKTAERTPVMGTGGAPGAGTTGANAYDQQPVVAPGLPSLTGTSGTSSGSLGAAVTGGTSASALVPADSSRVVKTGALTLAVGDGKVTATVVRLQALVSGLGGYVADSSSQEAGDNPSATLTVRVPVARFEALVAQVRALKVKVVSAQTGGKDVTAQYADTQAQIESLRAARGRYLAILARARTIGETLTVQQRVDDVQGQIDRLEGQRRVLADQSDLGTLTFSVSEQVEQLAASEPSGWSKAWKDARHGFSSGLQSLLAGSGRALLVLLVGLVVLVLGRIGWRQARRRLV